MRQWCGGEGLRGRQSEKKYGRSWSSGMKRDACRRMARQVPVSNAECAAIVSVCVLPSGKARLNLTWLPR